MNNNYDYKRLTPFKWFVLQNFPFIDEDFNAITNYQLFCKLGEEINKVIESMNLAGAQVEELTNYVNNFFDNLDVQDEVDNKLDEMAESGELTDIIAQYLQLAGLLCFNTKVDLKSAQNLVNGSFAKTYGTLAYNDGYGYFYKIRQIQSADVVDDDNIIALTNYNNLIAEKIIDANITNINTEISNIEDEIESLSYLSKKYIFIGDSYNTTDTPQGGVPIVPWSSRLINYLGLTSSDYYNSGVSGAGWVNGTTFLQQLQSLSNNIQDKSKITDIIVLGGINDPDESNIYDAFVSFSNYVETNYPNALITIGIISWAKGLNNRENLRKKLQVYNNASAIKNIRVINNSFTWFHNYLHYQPDGHPNESGSRTIAYFLANFLKGGENSVKWKNTDYISSSNNNMGITGNIGSFTEMFNGDTASLGISLNNSISTNFNIKLDGTAYKLGEMIPQTIFINDNTPATYLRTVSVWLYDGSTFHNIQASLRFIENSLYLRPETVGSDINNIQSIHISQSGFINIPAEYC